MINNIEEHEKKMAEWCDEYNKEGLRKENENLKAPVPSCETLRQPECCEFYNNAFDILGYAVLIRLCVDILEEAKKYRPNITIEEIINGVNEGKIKLSLYGYDILSPDSGERPKVEFVD